MIRLDDYLILESAEDLEENWYDYINETRLDCGVIYHNGDRKNYPQFYKFEEPWDAHFCGHWHKCNKQEIINVIEEKINNLKKIKEKCLTK